MLSFAMERSGRLRSARNLLSWPLVASSSSVLSYCRFLISNPTLGTYCTNLYIYMRSGHNYGAYQYQTYVNLPRYQWELAELLNGDLIYTPASKLDREGNRNRTL